MVEWLLTDTRNQPFREQLLTSAASGNFFKVYVTNLLGKKVDLTRLFFEDPNNDKFESDIVRRDVVLI
jgi:hypothetical protein